MTHRILLTNDDGIDAPGLSALWQSVRHALGEQCQITVVAPDRGRSECGHSVTTGRPLRVSQPRPGWYAVDGTPVDCVRVGLASLCPQAEMVLSGVNSGANLGVDLLVSGTFAAAREAAMECIPAMAVSHYRRPDVPRTWDHVPGWMAETIGEFVRRATETRRSLSAEPWCLWNVNLPAVEPATLPQRIRCGIDPRPIRRTVRMEQSQVIFESDFHGRPREQGSDVEHCFSGSITLTEVPRLFW